jgi:hypothetical protein
MVSRVVGLTLAIAIAALAIAGPARAVDFYELQIYYVDTVPQYHLSTELHSSSVTTSTGTLARDELPTYQIHNTLEASYGLLPWLEVGQYLASARLDTGTYEYAGSRTKVHFGIPQTEAWPVSFGMNVELAYMRRAADPHSLSFDFMPIAQVAWGRATLVGNFDFDKPFTGPGNKGLAFAPAAALSYRWLEWLEPRLEYWGDMGPLSPLASVDRQQHFIAPGFDLIPTPALKINFGVGLGLTRASNGAFVKSTVGWLF